MPSCQGSSSEYWSLHSFTNSKFYLGGFLKWILSKDFLALNEEYTRFLLLTCFKK